MGVNEQLLDSGRIYNYMRKANRIDSCNCGKLKQKLQYDRVHPMDPNGKDYLNSDCTTAFGIQIANWTRNVNIQSQDPYPTMARGHTMFMHNVNVNVIGASFMTEAGNETGRSNTPEDPERTSRHQNEHHHAGNSKTSAITIYPDSTTPRVGGSSNPSGAVNPSSRRIT